MNRIAIIGASGQLGRSITEALKQHFPDAEIIPLSRKTPLVQHGYFVFDPVTDDWSKLGNIDILINSAGIIQESKDAAFHQVHVDLMHTIIENRQLIGNPKIIHISALGADPLHPIAFLRTKGIGDQILLKQQDTYILRPSIVCTPNALLVQKFKILFELSSFYLFNHTLLPTDFSKTRIQPVMPADLQKVVVALCKQKPEQKVWNVVGAEEISFGWLMELASGVRNQKIKTIEIPKNLVASVTKNFISVWFPGLISYDQFQLLFKDNIADKRPMEQLIGKQAESTLPFWENEFKD